MLQKEVLRSPGGFWSELSVGCLLRSYAANVLVASACITSIQNPSRIHPKSMFKSGSDQILHKKSFCILKAVTEDALWSLLYFTSLRVGSTLHMAVHCTVTVALKAMDARFGLSNMRYYFLLQVPVPHTSKSVFTSGSDQILHVKPL